MSEVLFLNEGLRGKVDEFIRENNPNISLENSASNLIIMDEEGEVSGLIQSSEEKWDSEMLNARTVKLNSIIINAENKEDAIQKALSFIKRKGVATNISFQPEATDFRLIRSLMNNGFEIMGLPIILSLDPKSLDEDFTIIKNIRKYKGQDLSYLQVIARNTFKHSHLYHNPNLKEVDVDNLYSSWVTNDCKGRADMVFVVEEEGKAVGFIACKIKDTNNKKEGWIDLIAVSKNTRSKGLGSELVKASVNWFKDKVDEIKVKTEAMNYPSLRMYQKSGFKVSWTGLNLNLWLE